VSNAGRAKMGYYLRIYSGADGSEAVCIFDGERFGSFSLIPYDGYLSLEPLQMMMIGVASLADATHIIRKQLTPP